MRRKKYFISNDLKRNEKVRRAAEIIESLTQQLMTGWNPWISSDESRASFCLKIVSTSTWSMLSVRTERIHVTLIARA